MKTIMELRDELSHNIRAAKDITDRADKENRKLTSEERTLADDYMKKAGDLKAEVAELEAHEKRRQEIEAAFENLQKSAGRQSQAAKPSDGAPPDDEPVRVPSIPANIKRTGKLRAFTGQGGDARAYRVGQFLRATFGGSYTAQRWCDNNGVDYRNAMAVGSNTAGGFLVPDEMSQAIIDLREQYGVFRREARVQPMSSDTLTVPRIAGNITAYFTNENTAITDSDMALGQVNLVAKKLAALTFLSSELDEDAIVSMADTLARDMAWAFALKEDQCGFNGDGSATYGGIHGITEKILSLKGAVDAASTHDTFAEIDTTDLTTAMAALPQYARMNAKFYCSQVCFDIVFSRLAAVAGGNTIQTISGAYAPSFLGYPIVVSQVLPTETGDLSDKVMLLFGDLSMASTLGERRGITLRRSDEVKFVEDQVALKATERIDINNHSLGTATEAGAIVALIGE